jgi:hypothetical protein
MVDEAAHASAKTRRRVRVAGGTGEFDRSTCRWPTPTWRRSRRGRQHPGQPGDVDGDSGAVGDHRRVVSRRPEAEPATPHDDLRGLLWACAHPGLTEEQRVLLTARAVAGLMPSEIAALLGLPEAEIKKRLDGAKTGLRKLGGRAAVAADAEAERTALVAAAVAAIKAAPGAEAAAVGALLDERYARAFATPAVTPAVTPALEDRHRPAG